MSDADPENKNIQVVKTMVENGLAGRWDVVKRYVADDLVIEVAAGMPYGRAYHGWQGYREIFAEMGKFWSEISVGPNEFAAVGNKVAVISHLQGRIAKNGKSVSMPLTEIWEVADGQIVKITAFYCDTKLISDLAAQ